MKNVRKKRGGFTLVETLLALALLTALLLALNVFIFSMGEIWGQNRQRRLFDQHVRAVTRYLEDLLRQAARRAPEGDTGGLRAADVLMPAGGTSPLLTFDLPEGNERLPWSGAPLPDVRCALEAGDRGLLLYWQSRWELDFEKRPPRATVLSPLVTSLGYDFYRAEFGSWQTQSVPPRDSQGKWTTPSRLRLHFQYGQLAADSIVNVPPVLNALPAF